MDKKDVFEYLDTLRDSEFANMFEAAPYIQDAFEVDQREAIRLLNE